MFGVGTCKIPTRRWNWSGSESEQIPNGLKLQLSLCGNVCGGRVINWQLQHHPEADLSETTRPDLSNWFERDPWHIERGISGISGRNRTFFIPAGLTSSSPAGVHLKSRLNWRKSVRKRKKRTVSAFDYIFQRIFWRQALSPKAGNDPQKIRYNSTSSNKAHYLQEA